MKNIFNYATKELSQDAFLRWFFESYEDSRLLPIVLDFISSFTKNQEDHRPQLNLSQTDIKRITTKAQLDNIDVVVDIYTNDDNHYTIAIEDKTDSNEHNQLKTYNGAIEKWNHKNVYKVFYKTNIIGEEEKKRVDDAGWTPFSIKDIYEFFLKYSDTKTGIEVFDSYAEHVVELYKDSIKPSDKCISEWNYTNYQTFFEHEIKPNISSWKEKDDYHVESWSFQGRLVSVAFYYHPKNDKLLKGITEKYPAIGYPLVEFVYRKNSNVITVYTHITYHWMDKGTECWDWKNAKYEGAFRVEADNLLESLKQSLRTIEGIKVYKATSSRAQTISTDMIPLKENAKGEDIKQTILNKIEEYFQKFKEADNNF